MTIGSDKHVVEGIEGVNRGDHVNRIVVGDQKLIISSAQKDNRRDLRPFRVRRHSQLGTTAWNSVARVGQDRPVLSRIRRLDIADRQRSSNLTSNRFITTTHITKPLKRGGGNTTTRYLRYGEGDVSALDCRDIRRRSGGGLRRNNLGAVDGHAKSMIRTGS